MLQAGYGSRCDSLVAAPGGASATLADTASVTWQNRVDGVAEGNLRGLR